MILSSKHSTLYSVKNKQTKKPYFLVHYSNLFLENSQGQNYCPHLMDKEIEACDTEEMTPFFIL